MIDGFFHVQNTLVPRIPPAFEQLIRPVVEDVLWGEVMFGRDQFEATNEGEGEACDLCISITIPSDAKKGWNATCHIFR